jgi:hypothetical protein
VFQSQDSESVLVLQKLARSAKHVYSEMLTMNKKHAPDDSVLKDRNALSRRTLEKKVVSIVGESIHQKNDTR